MRRRRAHKADLRASSFDLLCPLDFVPIINQRGQHDCQIAVNRLVVARHDDFVSGLREDGGQVSDVYARHILEDAAHIFFEAGHERMTLEAGAVPAGYGVLIDVSVSPSKISENYLRQRSSLLN